MQQMALIFQGTHLKYLQLVKQGEGIGKAGLLVPGTRNHFPVINCGFGNDFLITDKGLLFRVWLKIMLVIGKNTTIQTAEYFRFENHAHASAIFALGFILRQIRLNAGKDIIGVVIHPFEHTPMVTTRFHAYIKTPSIGADSSFIVQAIGHNLFSVPLSVCSKVYVMPRVELLSRVFHNAVGQPR